MLVGIYVAVLVAANAAGSKLIAVGSLAASATVFAYAISFLVTDLASELYGKRVASQFVVAGFVGVLLAVGFFRIATVAPPASFYADQEAFEAVFQTSWRLLLGGFMAYLISQFLDIQIYHFLKKLTRDRHMWIRNNASTVCSQFVDTTVFITVAFYGIVDSLWPLILGQYAIKIVIAALDTPILYGLVYLIRKTEKNHIDAA